MKSRWILVPLIGAASLLVVFSRGAAGGTAVACTLDPEVRAFTVNQGLNSHARIVRGKDTLVRFYLGLPSCAAIASGAYIQIRKGELTVKNGSTVLNAGGTPLATTPSTLGSDGSPSTFPNVTTAGSPTLSDSPADLKFAIPGSVLAAAGTTGSFTLTLELKLFYRSAATSTTTLPASDTTKLLTTIAGTNTAFTKAVDKQTKALRILTVPMGTAPLSAAASDTLQGAMLTLGRIFPVPAGTQAAPTIGAALPTTGGIRYAINGGQLDLSAFTKPFCGSSTNWSLIQSPLAGFLQTYNAANLANPADRVIGVIADTDSVASTSTNGCDEGRASVVSPEGWIRLVPGVAGALLSQEVAHTFTAVPSGFGSSYHAIHPDWADWATGDTARAFNVTDRIFLPRTPTTPAPASPTYNRPAMRYQSTNWGNNNTVFEAGDYGYGYLECKLGGTTTSACGTSGTTGTLTNVAASPAVSSFVMTGKTNGTKNGTTVLESYRADTLPTTPDPASPYRLIQKTPSGDVSQGVPVSFDNTHHTANDVLTSANGVFSIAFPLAAGVTQFQFVYNGVQLMNPINVAGATPQISTPPPIPLAFSAARTHRAKSPAGTPKSRVLAASGDIKRTINVSPAPSCGLTVGVAFDGSELLVSCAANNVITRVNPANGDNLGSLTINGVDSTEGIGAISWDSEHTKLWLGTANVSPQKIYSATIDKTAGTGSATLAFSHTTGGFSIVDGLAYDGSDDSIWLSPDIDQTVYHYTQVGGVWTETGSFSVSGKLGSCGNSGIAVANATTLYLANDGCSEIYSSTKDGQTISRFAGLSGKRVEDLECDNATFASQNTSVIWSKDAYDYELNAFEVPTGQCAQGGVTVPPPPSTEQTVNYSSDDTDTPTCDQTSDVLLKHPNGGFDVLAVGLAPNGCSSAASLRGLQASQSTASFSYTTDVGCPGCEIVAKVYDGYHAGSATVAASTLDTFTSEPHATINNPTPGETYYPSDAIVLEGAGWTDAGGGLPASKLSWTSTSPSPLFSGTQPGPRVVLQPPNGAWPSGTYSITLTVTNEDNSKSDSKTITITVLHDADGDRMTDEFEACLGPGAATDPRNGGADMDGDHRKNSDERFTQNGPCLAESSYQARDAVWIQDPFDPATASGSIAVSGVYVPDEPAQVPQTGIAITQINGEIVPPSAGLAPTGSAFFKDVYALRFDATAFKNWVVSHNLRNQRILVRITGNAGAWHWDAYVNPYIK